MTNKRKWVLYFLIVIGALVVSSCNNKPVFSERDYEDSSDDRDYYDDPFNNPSGGNNRGGGGDSGGGGGDSGGGGGSGNRDWGRAQDAYEVAKETCGVFTPKQLASDLGTSTNPVDIATKFSKGYQAWATQAAFSGCMEGMGY